MADTSSRMLRLLSLLQTHRYWPGAELANRLEVSPRTLRRDVDRLRELGYPVGASRGVSGGYQLQPGAVLPPLLLDDEEAVAIVVGLRTATGGAVAGIEETSVRALAKVTAVMPPRLRRRVEALRAYTVPATFPRAAPPGPTIDPGVLTLLAQACRDDERIRFDYTPREGPRTPRLAEPHRLVCLGRRWYLVAWDLERHDWRSFRVDRLSNPVTTGARFRPRVLPGGDAAAFVQAGIAAVPTRYQVLVTVHAPATEVGSMVAHWGTVEEIDAGSCRLRMSVDSLDWPAMVLGAVGAEVEVSEPPELLDHLQRIGARFLRATKTPAPRCASGADSSA